MEAGGCRTGAWVRKWGGETGELFLGDACMDCLLGFTFASSEAGLLQKVEKLLPQGLRETC